MSEQANLTLLDTSPAALKARAARVISRALASGDLRHPNNPQGALFLPGMQSTGHRSQETTDAIDALGVMLGEALIDTVLTQLGAQLVTDTDLQALTETAVNTPSRTVTLQCDHGHLMDVYVKPGTDIANIRCAGLRASLAKCESKS
jgi:hypothetical protein